MNLQELKQLIDLAIRDCQRIVNRNPNVILSEGDFERILAECISKRIGYVVECPDSKGFVVHSQISHYDNERDECDAQVDILLARPTDIKPYSSLNKKYIIYSSAESFAIELKYRHDAHQGCVTAAKEDIDKFLKYYKEDSYYYSIILLDKNRDTSKHKREIMDYYQTAKSKLERDYAKKFFCKVLVKPTNR